MSLFDRLRGFEVPERVRHVLVRLVGASSFPNCTLGKGSGAWWRIVVDVRGQATIGDRVLFLSGVAPCELRVGPQGQLTIGNECVFNYGVSLEAQHAVRIGNRCMFGSFARIADQTPTKQGPVILGNNVWVAHGAIIEPGVTIGDNAVISAGSVVTTDVPANTMAMGNPARVMQMSLAAGGEE